MFEDLGAKLSSFTVRFSPALNGIFEPVSAVMFLNAENASFQAMIIASSKGNERAQVDTDLLETFWHEAYHCFQTYCTGYLFWQRAQLQETWTDIETSPERQKHIAKVKEESAGIDRRIKKNSRMPRDMQIAFEKNYTNLFSYERLQYLQDRSSGFGQPSVAGAAMPELYSSLETVRAPSKIRGSDGVSAQDVIEASAFIYGKEIAFGRQGLESRIHDDTLEADGPYQRAIAVADQVCPHHPPEIIRAASALALRYEHPGEAYVPLLRRLSAESPGDEASTARRLSHSLPAIPAAGRYMGTACDVQRDAKLPGTFYEDQLTALRNSTWGIDEIDLLVNANGINGIPSGQLGFALALKDQLIGGGDPGVLKARLYFGTRLLPTGPSVVELRREFEAATGQRLSDPAFSEENQKNWSKPGEAQRILGNVYRHLERFEEAITSYQEALAIMRETGDRHGEAWLLADLGDTYQQIRQPSQADACWREAAAAQHEVGHHEEAERLEQLAAKPHWRRWRLRRRPPPWP
jgi:tetratricopeptide (TPR) repeat protein